MSNISKYEWISAEPRPATTYEVKTICDNALALWNGVA